MSLQQLAAAKEVEEKMSEEDIMSQRPENMKQLRKLVKNKIIDKWDQIAIQLGFTPAEIQAIKNSHRAKSVGVCCTEMLFDWIDNVQSANPDKALVDAIKEVEYGYQADILNAEMKNDKNILEHHYLQTKIIPEVAVKWHEIGLELNIPAGKLGIIKNNPDPSGACCLDMLQLWFNRGNVQQESNRPTWKNMYDAMCAIDLNARAADLKESILRSPTSIN